MDTLFVIAVESGWSNASAVVQAVCAAVIVILTGGLVVVTKKYTEITKTISIDNAKQMKATQQMASDNKLLVEVAIEANKYVMQTIELTKNMSRPELQFSTFMIRFHSAKQHGDDKWRLIINVATTSGGTVTDFVVSLVDSGLKLQDTPVVKQNITLSKAYSMSYIIENENKVITMNRKQRESVIKKMQFKFSYKYYGIPQEYIEEIDVTIEPKPRQ